MRSFAQGDSHGAIKTDQKRWRMPTVPTTCELDDDAEKPTISAPMPESPVLPTCWYAASAYTSVRFESA
jgi:hypothetical protein